MKKEFYFFKNCLILFCLLTGTISAEKTQDIFIPIINVDNVQYFNYNEFVNRHHLRHSHYESKDKYEIIYNNTKMYLSPYSSFCKANSKIYQLGRDTMFKNGKLYVPLLDFYKILKKENIPFKITAVNKNHYNSSAYVFNINEILVNNKTNGTTIEISTTQKFKKSNIATSIASNSWLNITVMDGIIDSVGIAKTKLRWPIKAIKTIQLNEIIDIHLKDK